MEFFTRLFDPSGFPARWQCGTGWSETPWLGWIHVYSDIGIWTAYFAIPIVLGVLVYQKRDVPFRSIFLLFAAFILLCGLTHLTEAVIFWWPAYRFAAALKLVTAVVSWGTVLALIPTVPLALALRSPLELEREINARCDAERQLQEANAELEKRVRSRTAALQKAIEDLSSERELLKTTLRSIGDGVIVTDTDGNVTFVNGVAEELTGWQAQDASGVALEAVFNIVNETTRETVDNPARRALREGIIVGLANHTILIARDNSERPIDDSAAPIKIDSGLAGAVLVFRDISDRKKNELEIANTNKLLAEANSALQRSEAGLQLAIAIAEMGTFEIDLETDMVTVNAPGRLIYGWTDSEPLTFTKVQTHFHENDKIYVMESIHEAIYRAEPGEFEVEQRIIRTDNQIRWIRVRGKSLFTNENQSQTPSKIAGTFLDITNRRQLEDELRQSAEELVAADRRKDEFLATLAHELRNPLAPIRNGLYIMQLVANDPSQMEETRAMMERQLSHMVRLVDDLLDVSRITRNRLELRKENVQLKDILEQAIDASQPLIDAHQHRLSVNLPSHAICLHADPTRLIQVFGNLLNNAAKYTETDGNIELNVRQHEGNVAVTVKDSGIGIPKNMTSRIFEMFTQVDGLRARTQSGLGIGLTIVRRLVELHGGTIDVHSPGEGLGSEFTVTLPILASPLQIMNSPDAPVTLDTNSLRILVADDNVDAAQTLAMMLRFLKHDVKAVFDGKQAVSAASSYLPNVILLDIGMPEMNGYEAATAIRALNLSHPLTLVALTGWGQEEDRRKSNEAGFDHHLVKPVDPTALKQLLSDVPR